METSATMTCPKCNTVQPKAESCRKCGVIIAKVAQSSATSPSMTLGASKREPSKTDRPSGKQKEKKPTSHVRTYISLGILLFLLIGASIFALYRANVQKKEQQVFEQAQQKDMTTIEQVYRVIMQLDSAIKSGTTYAKYDEMVTAARTEIEIARPKIQILEDKLNVLIDTYNFHQAAKSAWTASIQDDHAALSAIIEQSVTDPDLKAVCSQEKLSTAFDECAENTRQWLWAQSMTTLKAWQP